jgi:sulfur carrier protein
MQVFVNNKLYELPVDVSLKSLPEIIGLKSGQGVAFAINNSVIPNTEWEKIILKEGDNILLIKAFQGG